MPPKRLADVRSATDLPFAASLTRHTGDLGPDEDYDRVRFDKLTFDDPASAGSRFLECAFSQVSVSGGQFRKARFSEVWLSGVRLTATDIAETSWTTDAFRDVVLAGLSAHGSLWREVTFQGCKLTGVNFRGATLTEVTFQDCLLRDVDFGSATLRRCRFGGSRLEETDFTQVSLDEVDLRGADLGLIITPSSLRGAIVSTAQLTAMAPLIAEHLGIVVADDPG